MRAPARKINRGARCLTAANAAGDNAAAGSETNLEGVPMKFLIAFCAAASALAAVAVAGEMTDACVARLEAEGRDTSGCSCLENKIAGNSDLESEFRELGEIDDPAERYASASDDAKAAMDACTR
jgi:hypothetical protein